MGPRAGEVEARGVVGGGAAVAGDIALDIVDETGRGVDRPRLLPLAVIPRGVVALADLSLAVIPRGVVALADLSLAMIPRGVVTLADLSLAMIPRGVVTLADLSSSYFHGLFFLSSAT